MKIRIIVIGLELGEKEKRKTSKKRWKEVSKLRRVMIDMDNEMKQLPCWRNIFLIYLYYDM